MKQTLILSFLTGATIQAFIAGFLGKAEEITLSAGQQITAASLLILFASVAILAMFILKEDFFRIQASQLAGMAAQAFMSGVLINAGIANFGNYHFQLSLGAAYSVILIALAWEWQGKLRLP